MNTDQHRSVAGIPDTEAIDRLFLELSQFTKATTAKELSLIKAINEARAMLVDLEKKINELGTRTQVVQTAAFCSTIQRFLNNARSY